MIRISEKTYDIVGHIVGHIGIIRYRRFGLQYRRSARIQMAPRADSDTLGRLQPTPSEGRQRWHYDSLSSPQPRDHVTFGSGPTRQSDVRDSEPDYLLRPTRHGPGGTLLDSGGFHFRAQVIYIGQDLRNSKGWSFNDIFGIQVRYF